MMAEKLVRGVSKKMIKILVNRFSADIVRILFGIKATHVMHFMITPMFRDAVTCAMNTGMLIECITSMCISSIYEMNEYGAEFMAENADIADSFLVNNTIDYSDLPVGVSRLLYVMTAVGSFVRKKR